MEENVYPVDRAIKRDGVKGLSCPRLRCKELFVFQEGERVPVENMVAGQVINGINTWAKLSPIPGTAEHIFVHSLDLDLDASVFMGRVKWPTGLFAFPNLLSKRRVDLNEGDVVFVNGDEDGDQIDGSSKWYLTICDGRKGYVHSSNIERTE